MIAEKKIRNIKKNIKTKRIFQEFLSKIPDIKHKIKTAQCEGTSILQMLNTEYKNWKSIISNPEHEIQIFGDLNIVELDMPKVGIGRPSDVDKIEKISNEIFNSKFNNEKNYRNTIEKTIDSLKNLQKTVISNLQNVLEDVKEIKDIALDSQIPQNFNKILSNRTKVKNISSRMIKNLNSIFGPDNKSLYNAPDYALFQDLIAMNGLAIPLKALIQLTNKFEIPKSTTKVDSIIKIIPVETLIFLILKKKITKKQANDYIKKVESEQSTINLTSEFNIDVIPDQFNIEIDIIDDIPQQSPIDLNNITAIELCNLLNERQKAERDIRVFIYSYYLNSLNSDLDFPKWTSVSTPEDANRCLCIINGNLTPEEKIKFNNYLIQTLGDNEEKEPIFLCSPNLESALTTLLRIQRENILFNDNQFDIINQNFNLINEKAKKKAEIIVEIFDNVGNILTERIEELSLNAIAIATSQI